jgi:putative flippase GtrA
MPDLAIVVRFLLVGGSTALLFLSIMFGLIEAAGLHTTVASTIACMAAICYNYLLHYHWTFGSDAPHGRVLVRYLVTCVGAVVLNGLIMHFGLELFTLHYLYVQLLAGVAMVLWTFSVSSVWVFRNS